jgi:release factor glutamine methyltransferase
MTYRDFWNHLTTIYDEGEAKAVARMVYEVRFGLSWTDLCIGKDTQLSADNQTELQEILRRLLQKEPVQYVLGQADFCGRTFLVNEHVLIPRPETEELIQWFLEVRSYLGESEEGHILDIGTGSGCIAITLAAMYPNAHVTAWDISPEALDVAKVNAGRHHVSVTFQQVDILAPSLPTPHSSLTTIISNPPYIADHERATMEANVLEYEPATALFVPDEDPLLFYRAIATYGQTALQPGGWLYFEINPLYVNELCELLRVMRFHRIETKEDQFGKQRFIRAQRS